MKIPICALALSALALFAQAASLPDPAPPFQAAGGKRLDPELKVNYPGTSKGPLAQPALWLGNKRVSVREEIQYTERDAHDQIVSLLDPATAGPTSGR